MDSFYELSRNGIARPYSSNNTCLRPMVPDVSMLQDNSGNPSIQVHRRPDEHLSYNAWKSTQAPPKCEQTYKMSSPHTTTKNIEHSPMPLQVSTSMLRKQVRFQSPNLRQQDESPVPENNVFESNQIFGPTFNNNCKSKISNFENIYLANIPNRKLDLSIIEPAIPRGKKVLDNCSKLAQLEKKADTPIYDILNYQSPSSKTTKELELNKDTNKDHFKYQTPCRNSSIGKNKPSLEGLLMNKITNSPENSPEIINSNQNYHHLISKPPVDYQRTPIKSFQSMQTSNNQFPEIPKESVISRAESTSSSTALVPSINSDNSDQPTVRDLLKIIQQQNEQLLILQKQVATLIDNQQTQHKAIENQQQTDKIINEPNTFQVFDKDKFCPKKNPMVPNKFNIDVMTSFEVSIRPQQKQNGRPFDAYQEAKIQEITEDFDNNMLTTDKVKQTDHFNEQGKTNEMSLMLSEPLQVQEGRMSPEQSVHVDMHDYSSDSDCDSNDSSDLGWTIYNNVMGQINNILTKANVAKMDQMGTQQTSNDKIRSKTMKKVKEATLRHLQSIGVHIPADDTSDSLRIQNSTDGLDYSPTEVSFAVQQLLMKYLPSEQLAKLSNLPHTVQNDGRMPDDFKRNKSKPKENLVHRRPEFSFATVQYMKKYNLMASLEDEGIKIPDPQKNKPIQHKFLDITALKKHPKLL